MGKPEGSYVRQDFGLDPNGNFSVRDDHGNAFSFTVPVVAPGISTITLIGNSTAAVYETKVTAGPIQLADMKLTFSI
jgi:hypothetical protein